MSINTFSSDIVLLICSYLDDLSYVHLHVTCKRYYSLLKSELFLRKLFYNRGYNLSLEELQRGFSFIASHRTVTVWTNGERRENTERMIAGLYRIDIFGRLFRKDKHLDDDIVEIQSLFIPRESCLTLSGSGALVMRIMGAAQPRLVADNVKWFSLSVCGDIILCRQGDKLYAYDISSKMKINKHLYGSLVDIHPFAIDDIVQIEATMHFYHSIQRYLILTRDGTLLLNRIIVDQHVSKIVHLRFPNECLYYYLKGSTVYFRRLNMCGTTGEIYTNVADIEQMGPKCFKIVHLDGTYKLYGGPFTVTDSIIHYQHKKLGSFGPGGIKRVTVNDDPKKTINHIDVLLEY